MGSRVRSSQFYSQYHGHPVTGLEQVLAAMDETCTRRVFLAGDSSLDNKHWLFRTNIKESAFQEPLSSSRSDPDNDRHTLAPALSGYSTALSPPLMVKDVTYWCQREAQERGKQDLGFLNCAVEESALSDRRGGRLLEQDEFVRDNIRSNDILIVSVGGNDVVLKPSTCTMLAMFGLTILTPGFAVSRWRTGFGIRHMAHLFGPRVQRFIEALTAKVRPRAVIVCSIYYPCAVTEGWASTLLNLVGYGRNPAHLQSLIQLIHDRATSNITLAPLSAPLSAPPSAPPALEQGDGEAEKEGDQGEKEHGAGVDVVDVEDGDGGGGVGSARHRGPHGRTPVVAPVVIPIKLCEVLDANDASDYEAQVEPSIKGGRKMAKAFLDALESHNII